MRPVIWDAIVPIMTSLWWKWSNWRTKGTAEQPGMYSIWKPGCSVVPSVRQLDHFHHNIEDMRVDFCQWLQTTLVGARCCHHCPWSRKTEYYRHDEEIPTMRIRFGFVILVSIKLWQDPDFYDITVMSGMHPSKQWDRDKMTTIL